MGWVICAVAVTATAVYATNKFVESGHISTGTSAVIGSVVESAASSVFSLGGMGDFYTGDLTPGLDNWS